jgi:hypothetical protein
LASLDQLQAIRAILEREIACHYSELVNRTYAECGISSSQTKSASTILEATNIAERRMFEVKGQKPREISFIYLKNLPQSQVNNAIESKGQLMAKHYDRSEEIGHHGERIVVKACKSLGYSEIERRKEKHGSADIGIAKHDIDVWAKHPSGGYYQNIEVKNRRDPLKEPELSSIVRTTSIAKDRWNLEVRPAVVTVFAHTTTRSTAGVLRVPIAFSDGIYVPEEHRDLYEALNLRLALNVVISNEPTDLLRSRIERYIMNYQY